MSIAVSADVQAALAAKLPVVALESTLISHGLPYPENLHTACRAEEVIRELGGIPATVAVVYGVLKVGLSQAELSEFAESPGILKASRRDLGFAIMAKKNAATTVSATMAIAHQVGIEVFATGGIGGAHRPPAPAWDISADLQELARTPMCVICAGAKSILDIPRTLEILETLGVPVVGFRTDTFPHFYTQGGTESVSARVESAREAAELYEAQRKYAQTGTLLLQPLPADDAIPLEDFSQVLAIAENDATTQKMNGPALTPFLLKRISELTHGRTLQANQTLIINNARLAAEVAIELVKMQ